MSFRNRNLHNLFKVLRPAYLNKENVQPEDRLKVDVMRRIRSLHQHPSRLSFAQMLGQASWKLAPASALLILICVWGLINLELVPDWQVLQLMTNGIEDIILFEFLT